MTIKEQPGLDPRELAARGLTADLRLAVEHDVSQAVPRLSDGAFAQLS
jgi:phosphosulfolactate phosphohydrolase-like enzyme